MKVCELNYEASVTTNTLDSSGNHIGRSHFFKSPTSEFSNSSSGFNFAEFEGSGEKPDSALIKGKEEEIKSPRNKKYAVKIIRNKDEEYQRMALKEFKLLTQLDHPKIIKMREAFFNQSRETLYMILDLVDGPTLKKYVKE